MNCEITWLTSVLYLLLNCPTQIVSVTISSPDISASVSISFSSTQYDIQTNRTTSTCSCALFLSGQMLNRSNSTEHPVIILDFDDEFPCTWIGMRECKITCAEKLAPYLVNSEIICAFTEDRDIFKEQIFLFVKSCDNKWVKTVLTDRKKYCCKAGEYYNCPR